MTRPLRIVLLTLMAVLAAALAAVALLIASFDAAAAKAFVTERVQRATGRVLSVPGPVELSLRPDLGFRVGELSLATGDAQGAAAPLASARALRLSLAPWPLLRGRLEVGRVEIDGLRVHVVRQAGGGTPLDDLLPQGTQGVGPAGPDAPAAGFTLAGLTVRDAELTLEDRDAGRTLRLTGLDIDLGRLAPGVSADLRLRGRLLSDRPAAALALDVAGALSVDTAARRQALEDLRVGVDGDAAGQPLALQAQGRAARGPDGLQAVLDGTLGDSRFQARVQRAATPAAALQAEVEVDRLRVAGVQVEQLVVGARLDDGRVTLDPLRARLYEGSAQGTARVDLRGAQPRFGLDQTLTGVQLGPLLRDATGVDRLQGRGDATLQLQTEGADADAWRRALAGRARLSVRDGALRGVNVAQAIRQARAALERGPIEGAAAQAESTDFSELSASFTVAGGVARNDDLQARSPLLRLAGAGDIDLAAGRIDYLLQATVVDTLEGQGGAGLEALRGQTVPVRLSGPLDAVQWRIDFAAMAKQAARRELDRRRDEVEDQVKRRLEERLRKPLEGLFGR